MVPGNIYVLDCQALPFMVPNNILHYYAFPGAMPHVWCLATCKSTNHPLHPPTNALPEPKALYPYPEPNHSLPSVALPESKALYPYPLYPLPTDDVALTRT